MKEIKLIRDEELEEIVGGFLSDEQVCAVRFLSGNNALIPGTLCLAPPETLEEAREVLTEKQS